MAEYIENIQSDFEGNEKRESEHCDPCLLSDRTRVASQMCEECKENLCETCVKIHLKSKATSSHKPIQIEDIKKTGFSLCTPCFDDDNMSKAVTFCKECDEFLCEICTDFHRKRKASRQHNPIALEHFKDLSREIIPLCQPCEDNVNTILSSNFCKICDEYLCDACTKSHLIRKATKLHRPIPVSSLQNTDEKAQFEIDKLCDPCISVNSKIVAKSFCQECEDLLCADCTSRHRASKLTKLHALKHPDFVEFVTINCELCGQDTLQGVMFCKTCDHALCELCAKKHKSHKITKCHTLEPCAVKRLKQIVRCDPCLKNADVKRAETSCKLCKEKLCESCTRDHRTQKLTKQHELVNLEAANFFLNAPCDLCLQIEVKVNANFYCHECDVYLCTECKQRHKKQKLTKAHVIIHINNAPKCDLKVCDQCDAGEKAFRYCVNCQEYLCLECWKIHKLAKIFKTHEVIEERDIVKVKKKDCDFCNSSETAELYCIQCEEFYCKTCITRHKSLKATRNHHFVPVHEGLAERVTGAAIDKGSTSSRELAFGPDKDTAVKSESIETKTRPGQPRASQVLSDSVTLSWEPPSQFEDDDYYQISYKDLDHDTSWKTCKEEYKSSTAVVNDLKSDTAFTFRVRVVYEDGEGPYSEESETVLTSDSMTNSIVKHLVKTDAGNNSAAIYVLPLLEIEAAKNPKAKIKKFEIGFPALYEKEPRAIMLVGATGTGKSTLVDGFVNYGLGVKWSDPFRFTVLDLEVDKEKNQALSQTELVTCYRLNPWKESRLKYQLTIIDTPGFGDTRGLKRDQEIIEQIYQLLSEIQPKGGPFIDAVCFLFKATDASMAANQHYIFQSIKSLVGEDNGNNMCSLITFADGVEQPVLAALNASGLQFGKSFVFNNSGLYARNAGVDAASLSEMFWSMNLKSFSSFFEYLEQLETKSLPLTQNKLEHFGVETTLDNLQSQLDVGLSKVACLKQEIKIIEKNKSLIDKNKNFEYEMYQIRQHKEALPRGRYVTNCMNCKFICHENCVFANDEITNCIAMDWRGNCQVCPDKCFWNQHVNVPYVFKYATAKVKKTFTDLQKKYQETNGKFLSQEEIVAKLKVDLNDLSDDTEDMRKHIKECIERLRELKVRLNPLTVTEYIKSIDKKEKVENKEDKKEEKQEGYSQSLWNFKKMFLGGLWPRKRESRSEQSVKKRNCDTKTDLA